MTTEDIKNLQKAVGLNAYQRVVPKTILFKDVSYGDIIEGYYENQLGIVILTYRSLLARHPRKEDAVLLVAICPEARKLFGGCPYVPMDW